MNIKQLKKAIKTELDTLNVACAAIYEVNGGPLSSAIIKAAKPLQERVFALSGLTGGLETAKTIKEARARLNWMTTREREMFRGKPFQTDERDALDRQIAREYLDFINLK